MTNTFESLVFAGTEWNDGTNFDMEEFDPGIAPKRFRWISGADSDGALSPEEAHYDNAEATVKIRVLQQADMDTALAKIGTLVQALQECEKQALGSAAVWTPATSTKALTMYVLGGEVVGLPINIDEGWFVKSPVITLKLYRRPFLYGAEVLNAATVTNTNRFQLLTVANVPGDVDAEARLVITDNATQSRRHVEWGLQQRYYDAATNLSVDSFVTSGFGGTSTTRSGSFNTNVIRGTLTTVAQGICGTGVLSHVGGYRVKVRVYAASTVANGSTLQVRLTWQEGDGPFRSNDYTALTVAPATSGWYELDLGTVAIPEKALGTQKWSGKIEAYSQTIGDTLDVDYVLLVPTECYGKGRAPAIIETLSALGARDEFDQTAGNLSGKTLPVGGTWSTVGADATDLAVETTGHTVQRSTTGDTSGKIALAGTTTYTDVVAQVDWKTTSPVSVHRLMVRYVDASNYLKVEWNSLTEFLIQKVIAGTASTIAYKALVGKAASTFYSVRVFVTAGGLVGAVFFDQGGSPTSWTITGYDATLATGGTLASGKVGFMDINMSGTAATRNYDNFWAGAGTPQVVVYSGRSAEIRHDSAIRQDSTGTYYGPLPSYRGDRLLLPPAGSANRSSRLFSKTRRNDIDVAQDDQIADSTIATLHYTPRFYVAPR